MYQYLETEEEIKHGDDEDAEIKYEEMLIEASVLDETAEETARKAALRSINPSERSRKTKMVKVICSCGSYYCGAIKHFGLPEPMFQNDIYPIPSQMIRDSTAVRLKMTL